MKIKKEFEIVYIGEAYSVELPNIIFDTKWENYLSNPIEVRIHGLGEAKLFDTQGKPTGEDAGRVGFEIKQVSRIHGNTSHCVKAYLELTNNAMQIFQHEGLIRVKVNVPVTWLEIPIGKGGRTNKVIRTLHNNSILEFKLK